MAIKPILKFIISSTNFDFESIFQNVDEDRTAKLEWTHKLPISDTVMLRKRRYGRITIVDDRRVTIRTERFGEAKWRMYSDALMEQMKTLDEDVKEEYLMCVRLKNMYDRLMDCIASVPVLGFNDTNLVNEKLAKHLNMHEQKHGFVVKQANVYSCIVSDTMKFLDISHILAVGTSYGRFRKAYVVNECKGFMPYEWLDDVTKLNLTELPPRDCFHSSLKGTDISEEEYSREYYQFDL